MLLADGLTLHRREPRKVEVKANPSFTAASSSPPAPGVCERSAAAPGRSTVAAAGVRGDLSMRGGYVGARAHATFDAKSEKKDSSPLGWLEDKASDVVHGAIDTAGGVVHGVEKGIDKIKGAAGVIGDAFDYGENIDKLGKGDKYTISGSADVSGEGVKAYGKGNVEIARGADGKYTVSADGELGGGLYGQLGAKLGGNASADGEATVGAGAKVEMKFDTAEEAKRATGILLKQASPVIALASGGPPSADDTKFMAEHASAIELRGDVAAKASAELGIGLRNAVGANAFAGGEIREDIALRIDLPQGSTPASVSVRGELSGKVELGVQAGLDVTKGQPGRNKDASLGWALQGEVKGKVAVEGKVDLPNLSRDALLSDPVGTVTRAGNKLFDSTALTTTVTLEGQGTAGKNGGGVEAKASFKQTPAALARSGALDHALHGRFEPALTAAGRSTKVDVSLTRFVEHGIDVKPELRVMGFGGSLGAGGIRRDYADKPDFTWQGDATQAARALSTYANGLAPYVATGGYRPT